MADSPASSSVTLERVLAVMGAVAIAAAVFAGSYQLMSRRAEEPTSSEPTMGLDAEPPSEPVPGPRIRRGMFRPPAALERPEGAAATAEPSAPAPRRAPSVPIFGGVPYFGSVPPVVTVLPPSGASDGGSSAPAAQGSSPPPRAAPGPPDVTVAITATVQGGDGLKALVENTTTGEARWVTAGGVAFGYRVSHITPRGGMVEKGGRAYVLPVGAGKPVPVPAGEPEQPVSAGKAMDRTEGRAEGSGAAEPSTSP